MNNKGVNMSKRICRYCSIEYTPKRDWQKYCSSNCRVKAWDKDNPRVKQGVKGNGR